jgi:hypothetical protein
MKRVSIAILSLFLVGVAGAETGQERSPDDNPLAAKPQLAPQRGRRAAPARSGRSLGRDDSAPRDEWQKLDELRSSGGHGHAGGKGGGGDGDDGGGDE